MLIADIVRRNVLVFADDDAGRGRVAAGGRGRSCDESVVEDGERLRGRTRSRGGRPCRRPRPELPHLPGLLLRLFQVGGGRRAPQHPADDSPSWRRTWGTWSRRRCSPTPASLPWARSSTRPYPPSSTPSASAATTGSRSTSTISSLPPPPTTPPAAWTPRPSTCWRPRAARPASRRQRCSPERQRPRRHRLLRRRAADLRAQQPCPEHPAVLQPRRPGRPASGADEGRAHRDLPRPSSRPTSSGRPASTA